MEGHGTLLLRAALVLYSMGLLNSLYSVVKHRRKLFKPALYAFLLGAALHGLSLASSGLELGRFPSSRCSRCARWRRSS